MWSTQTTRYNMVPPGLTVSLKSVPRQPGTETGRTEVSSVGVAT